jgi:hypothetical protein
MQLVDPDNTLYFRATSQCQTIFSYDDDDVREIKKEREIGSVRVISREPLAGDLSIQTREPTNLQT